MSVCQICFKNGMETSLQFWRSGWDQQMSYTWFSDRWVLPAPYYKTSMVYEDCTTCAHCRAGNLCVVNQCQSVRSAMLQGLGFDVDVYFLDTNFLDAKPPEEDCYRLCRIVCHMFIIFLEGQEGRRPSMPVFFW